MDIQGPRTLAIVAVVAFHISHYGDKQFFVNGGLGMDM
jgi:peptidoglycan/LPS O-acetylase OafA/YrhL